MKRLVVIGGGYAGVMAAVRAARRLRGRAQVLLVSDQDALVERIRLHETAAHGRDPRRPLQELLRGTGVVFVHARCDTVDRARREVIADGQSIAYDRLIVAIGSSSASDAVPGAREHAFALESESLPALGSAIERAAEHHGRLVVVGGGLSGLEAATELAERHPGLRVALLTRSAVGERLSDGAREHARRACARLKIDLREHVAVERIEPDAVIVPGERIAADVCLAAFGFRAPDALKRWGFPTDAVGRARVDAHLRLQETPEVYVAGDCAAVDGALGSPIPSGCKSAIPLGALAGENAAASMREKRERPVDWRDVVWCISLGRADAVIQTMRRDGTPGALWFGGRFGAAVKRFVCWATVRSIELERDGYWEYRYPRVRQARAPAPL
jgi:NADH dehydrogenase FAD-containing subunit